MKRPGLDPAQASRALDILTALVVISVAVALAGLTWRIAGHAGQGAITVPGGRQPVRTAPADLAPAMALAPFGKPTGTEAGQPTGISATLKGVMAASSPDLAVAYVAIGDQPPRAFRVGEALESATITAILRDRIVLSNGGRSEFLAFPDPAGTSPPQNGAPATPAANAAPGAPGLITSSMPSAQPAPPSPQAVIDRLGATRTANGYAIGANPPPGLRAGDIVQSVNGSSVADPAAAAAAFAAAQNAGQAQVQLLRDGRPISITIPLE